MSTPDIQAIIQAAVEAELAKREAAAMPPGPVPMTPRQALEKQLTDIADTLSHERAHPGDWGRCIYSLSATLATIGRAVFPDENVGG